MLINTTTQRTSARGITRVNEFNNDPRQFSFVFNKASQLSESPRVLLSALAMPNRHSVSDAAQVFKGDTPSSVFSLFNNPLADYVVDISSKSLFLAGTLFKKSFCLFRAVSLEFRPHLGMSFSKTINLISRVGSPIGVGSDINDTQVNSKKAIRFIRKWLWGIYHHCQIESAITEDKVGLPDYPIKPCFLISSNSDGDNLSSLKSQDGYLVQSLPREDALVINDSPICFESGLNGAVSLVGFGNLANGTDGKLCRKLKVLSYLTIDSLLKAKLTRCAKSKGNLSDGIASLVKSLHSLQKCFMLLCDWGKFDHQGLFHNSIIQLLNSSVNILKKGGLRQFLPPLKGTGFLGAIL